MSAIAQTSVGVPGAGTKIEYGVAGSPETFVAMVQVESITPPNPKWSYNKTTNLGSPAVGPGVLEEQNPNAYSPGTFSATILFSTASETGRLALSAAFLAQTIMDFKLILPGAGADATSAFSGYVSDFGYEGISADKNITYKLSVNLTTTVTES